MAGLSEAEQLLSSGQKYFAEKAYVKAIEEWELARQLFQKLGKKQQVGIISNYIGTAQAALGKYKEALVSSTQAVRILRELSATVELQQALLTMGRVLEEIDHLEEATQAFIQATEIKVGKGNPKKRVELLLEAGGVLRRANHLKESKIRHEEAVSLAKTLDDAEILSDALTAYARILQQLEEHQSATTILHDLFELQTKAGNYILGAHALLGIASSHIALGHINEAEANIHQAQEVFRKSGDVIGEALAKYHLARILLHKKQPENALAYAEQAFQFFDKEKEPLAQAQIDLIMGQIFEQLDQGRKALQLYERAINLFTKVGEKGQSLQATIIKGKALLRMHRREEAESEFGQVLRYYREHNRTELEARVYIEVAETLHQLGNYADAREQSKSAIAQLQKMEAEEYEIRAFRLLFQTAKASHTLQQEVPLLQESLERAKTQKKLRLAQSLAVSLAQLALETESPKQAIGVLEKAIQDADLPKIQRAEAALSLGQALMRQGQYANAAQYLTQAIQNLDEKLSLDKARAYFQLGNAYLHLNKPSLRKGVLEAALSHLPLDADDILQARLYLQLAPLIASTDADLALQYYDKAVIQLGTWEQAEEQFSAILGKATLLLEKDQEEKALEQAEYALAFAEELDIASIQNEQDPLPSAYLQKAVEIAVFIASKYYSKMKQRETIEKIIDWSTRRKLARVLPFLAENLGFERCTELLKLLQEEKKLISQVASARRSLDSLRRKHITRQEFSSKRDALRSKLNDSLTKLNVNRNVIAAACVDPGPVLPPQDYLMLQKIIALMPTDRRWILINYDVMRKENRIFITMVDHVGRHGNYTLPISPDLISAIEQFRRIQNFTDLPPTVQLQDLGTHLYRSLIPSLLERALSSHNYGYVQLISDDFLHHVPFELLFDGQQYWGLKYPINWAPDLIFLESTLKSQALAQPVTPSIVLGINTSAEEKVTRKRTAEEIVKAFMSTVPTTPTVSEPIVLFGQDFTRALLRSSVDQPRSLIYLSTPTKIHHRKGEVTLNPPDSLRAIELGVTTLFEGAPTLILDECVNVEPREDGLSLVAFLRHLVAAGITSTIFTRWLPDPKLQPHFASSIARHLFAGDPITLVLLHTRRKLASMQPTPQSWLAYTLCGNPFPSLR